MTQEQQVYGNTETKSVSVLRGVQAHWQKEQEEKNMFEEELRKKSQSCNRVQERRGGTVTSTQVPQCQG